jgi:tRNA (mo5U34)-methyltransferase
MNIEDIKKDRLQWFEWKNIQPLQEKLNQLNIKSKTSYTIDNCININIENITDDEKVQVFQTAHILKPWRKGPFKIQDVFIDSEWQSFIKYNMLKKHFNLEKKVVADVGCNNGYYMFRMLEENPIKVIGFDPVPIVKLQFDFINYFIKSEKLKFEMLGIEHCEYYPTKFDVIFCLGVLYHRSDPVSSLKSLFKALNKKGELILDTFMIDGEEEVALTPNKRYSKIPNIYFIPTIPALKNWCYRAGFKEVEVLEVMKTQHNEQRQTEWIVGESLKDFLNKDDETKTVEGYPAPKRVYIKAKV